MLDARRHNRHVDNLLSFAAKAGWALLISLVVLKAMGRIRTRVRRLVRTRGGDEHVVTIIDNLVRIAVYMIVGLVVIGGSTGSSASTVTAIGLITAMVSLSPQDVLRDCVSGLYLLIERPSRSATPSAYPISGVPSSEWTSAPP